MNTTKKAKNPLPNHLIGILTAEDSGSEPNGARAVSGPTGSSMSGFWLRVEGMVGMEDPGVPEEPPGDGRRGAISGDSGVSGGSGRSAGAAEMVGVVW